MKILLYTDVHVCPKTSIINKWGTKYTQRLENCISSLNWVEQVALDNQCDAIISLGDLFDKPDLSSETITAMGEVKWSNIPHYHIVGNHDASTSSLEFNSVNLLKSAGHTIIDNPQKVLVGSTEICFLPYILEHERKTISEYFDTKNIKRIILSHNDISGIQLGPVISRTGFNIADIQNNCDIFINGHLHNGTKLAEGVYNLGNLTGKDFGEDASKYSHKIAIVNTDTLEIQWIENPKAYNFYRLEINIPEDLWNIKHLKPNAVVSFKCAESYVDDLRKYIETEVENITDYRIIITHECKTATVTDTTINLAIDHVARFIECCRSNIENSSLLESELAEVCK